MNDELEFSAAVPVVRSSINMDGGYLGQINNHTVLCCTLSFVEFLGGWPYGQKACRVLDRPILHSFANRATLRGRFR
jgi:hypothetical protein